MSEGPFAILGTVVPDMLGRTTETQKIINELTKKTPGHISIIGPRFSGKTVILKALEQKLSGESSPYASVILWDLRHNTPISDNEFLCALRELILDGIKKNYPHYVEYLTKVDGTGYSELREVLEDLGDRGLSILMLWDGFDKPLGTGKLTRNLWDQLLELARSPGLRLVTASSRMLSDLIRSEESVTSDFWGVFTCVERIGCFNEADREEIYTYLNDFNFEESGKKELENWTAGNPPLFLDVLNSIYAMEEKQVTNDVVNRAAEISLESLRPILGDCWNDCSESARHIYRHLIEHGETPSSNFGPQEIKSLDELGFIKQSGNKTKANCRLIAKFIEELNDDSGSIVHLFQEESNYTQNIRRVLELRLQQLASLDPRLKRLIERALEDIPDYPEQCIVNMRGINDRAMDLIWMTEFEDNKVPQDYIKDWERRNEKNIDPNWAQSVPSDRVVQLRILQVLTGTRYTSLKAKKITKNTYILANSIHAIGNFGQHLEGVQVPIGVAVSAVTMSIELASCLNQELFNR